MDTAEEFEADIVAVTPSSGKPELVTSMVYRLP
jgi:hypothetical protein